MIYEHWLKDIREREIPISEPFAMDGALTNEVEIAMYVIRAKDGLNKTSEFASNENLFHLFSLIQNSWSSDGLSNDEFSIQNAVLTTKSSRFNICIDPQQQALTWIKKREANNFLKILSFTDSDFLKQLEMAITFGNAVLFQDIDDYIDPMIHSVLERNIICELTFHY